MIPGVNPEQTAEGPILRVPTRIVGGIWTRTGNTVHWNLPPEEIPTAESRKNQIFVFPEDVQQTWRTVPSVETISELSASHR